MTLAPLNIIVARADDGTIGHAGCIQWSIPEDMKRFRKLTMGHTVIMGRRTWESLPAKARPLKGRRNIVVSSTLTFDDLADWRLPPAQVFRSFGPAIFAARHADAKPFVIGGAGLYEEALPIATRIYLTEVHASYGGDTRLDLDLDEWTEVSREGVAANGDVPGYSFVELTRKEV